MIQNRGEHLPFNQLKTLKVFDKYFLYQVQTARHVEIDEKTCFLIRRHKGRGDKLSALLQSNPEIKPIFDVPSDSAERPDTPGLKNLILQVSHSCNLRCKYCSADFGRYGGKFRTMTLATATRAIDFLFETNQSSQFAITYFGGEPLLNLETVLRSARHALARAERAKKNISLHLVTNGVMLGPETLFRLDELGFSLTVSLDGPSGYHNSCRPQADGSGSYKKIVQSLRLARNLPIGQRITLRGTFTRESAAFYPIVKFLIEQSLSNNIAYEPVFLPFSHPLSLRRQDLPMIKQAYTSLAKYYVARWKKDRAFCLWDFDDAVTQLALGLPRRSRCGAGVKTLAVTAEENIYACHMSTGVDDAWLGTLEEGLADDRKKPWLNKYLDGRAGCSDCWLQALCGGGCNNHAICFNKNLSLPYRLECELIEHRYRLAFWILSEMREVKDLVRAALLHSGAKGADAGHLIAPLWSYRIEQ
jgi:uncharacterized protein